MADDPTSWGAEAVAEDPTAWGAKPVEGDNRPLNWADVPGQALQNAPHSAAEFGKALAQPVIHPIETAKSLKNIGQGVLEKAGIMSPADHEKYADAVGKFFVDRYGSAEGIKQTLAKDPVGAMADLSTVLTAGGGLAVRGAGLAGTAAKVARLPGQITDPLLAPIKAAEVAGKGAAQLVGGIGTHTGPEAIELAFQAGREGGQPAKAFKENIRGVAPMEETVQEALGAERQLRAQRSAAYDREMANVMAETPLGHQLFTLDNTDKALAKAERIGRDGNKIIDPDAVAAHEKISKIVDQWRQDPIHTISDMDKMKQAVGVVMRGLESNSAEKKIAGEVYGSIRNEIITADPRYGKAMTAYEKATDQLDELNRTLSINPNATIDTSLRKLQSTLRDNVNTSYGRRRELAQFLVDNGAPDLLYKLAGQTMKPWMPRGLGKLAASIGAEIVALGGGAVAAGGTGLGAAALAAPLMSPRMVGTTAYHAGVGSRYIPNLGAYQLGRMPSIENPTGFKKGGRVRQTFRYRG